jgi:histidine triad (HIT) family protein
MPQSCIFCRIISGEIPAYKVFEDDLTVVFLDSRPLFPGHCLVCPRQHIDTLCDLPPDLISPLFANAQLVAKAVEIALQADGSFVAVNNKISQSVPHLHVHVVPRRAKDGLKGFFWPRQPYKDETEAVAVQKSLQSALLELREQRNGHFGDRV